MEEVRAFLGVVGDSQAAVLIQGESGTGKELAARAIHRASPRRDGPFVSLNCGALPAQLLESELFGYEKGAFTGAAGAKPGQFELADGGTIFLDEIGECSPELQVQLLRVLQEQEVQRLGGTRRVRVDFRLVAATNRNLAEEVGRAVSARTSSTGSTWSRSRCRRCASGARTSRCWRPSSSSGSPGARARRFGGSPGRPWSACSRTTGRGTCASWRTPSSAGSWWAAGRCSRRRTCRRSCGLAGAAGPLADLAGRDLPLAEVEKAVVAAAMARHGATRARRRGPSGFRASSSTRSCASTGSGGVEAPDGEEA